MIITFESGPLKGKFIEVADNTLEYEVDLLPANLPERPINSAEPVRTVRLKYRRSNRVKDGAVAFYAHAS